MPTKRFTIEKKRVNIGGYSLPAVIALSALLAGALTVLMSTLISNAKVSGQMVAGRRAFYACDGMNRTLTRLSQNYMATTTAPDTTELKAFVCAAGNSGGPCPTTGDLLPDISPEGFEITDFDVSSVGARVDEAVIPSGPFAGMNSQQDSVSISTRAKKTGEGFRCRSDAEVTLARIAMFQFFLFADTYLDWQPGPPQRTRGRNHANYDVCLGSNNLSLENMSSAGRIMHISDGRCERSLSNSAVKIQAVDNTEENMADGAWKSHALTATSGNGCTNCNDGSGASGLDWKEFAIDRWGSNLQDEAHEVPRLRLPVSGEPQTQSGVRANGDHDPNNENSRFLIDPVRAVDTQDIREQKYAQKADIRILDGVWYIPDPTDPTNWPGVAIWSDHPGTYLTKGTWGEVAGIDVGQAGLRVTWAAAGYPWPTSPPKYFSYYEYDPSFGGISNDTHGAISYGTMERKVVGGVPVWEPGAQLASSPNTLEGIDTMNALCAITPPGPVTTSTYPAALAFTNASAVRTPFGWGAGFNTGVSNTLSLGTNALCTGATSPLNESTKILQATRSGIRDPHVHFKGPGAPNERRQRAMRFPVNVDVRQLLVALHETGPGELGSYFCAAGAGCFMDRPFNGIVYVSASWPGAQNGYGSSATSDVPIKPPMQGIALSATGFDFSALSTDTFFATRPTAMSALSNASLYDPLQPPIAGGYVQNSGVRYLNQVSALPFNLCSDDMNGDGNYILNDDSVPLDPSAGFRVPDCERYEASLVAQLAGTPTNGVLARFPDSVRFVNGRDLITGITLSNGSFIPQPTDFDADGNAEGLSIVTNLQYFVNGGMNVTSNTPDTSMASATPWVPFMLGGDRMYMLSDAFSDTSVLPGANNANVGVASNTNYNMAILAGWPTSKDNVESGKFENYPVFMERWSGRSARIRGSFVVGFHSAYADWGRQCCGNTSYSAPGRNWGFDDHLAAINNQPPGAPVFDISATRKWKAR